MDDFTLKLHSPITEEEWDILTDVDLEHSPQIEFHTKHGKKVTYAKVIHCEDCKYGYPISEVYVQCIKAHRTAEKHKKGWFCSDGEKV